VNIIFLLLLVNTVLCAGIAITPGEITLGNIPAGQTFDMSKMSAVRIVAESLSLEADTINISVYLPSGKSVKNGYEPVPDISWIKVIPEYCSNVVANKSCESYFTIFVPADEKYLGKKYQFMVSAQSQDGAVSLRASTTILFTVSEQIIDVPLEMKSNIFKFSVFPPNTKQEIPIGEKIKLFKSDSSGFIVSNLNNTACRFTFTVLDTSVSDYRIENGFTPAYKTGFLTFETNIVEILAGGAKNIPINIEIPDKKKYRKGKFAFVIKTTILTEAGAIESQDNILYVIVKSKGRKGKGRK